MSLKKIVGIVGGFIAVVVGPVLLISTPAMGCYQKSIDENPNSDSSKEWQLRLGKTCANTGRLELATDMYRKFIDRYKKDERRPDVMWRRAMCLKDLEKHNEAREQLKELIKGYPQTPLAKDARETLQLYYRDFGGY